MVEKDIDKRKTEVADHRVRSGCNGLPKVEMLHVKDKMTRTLRSLVRIARVIDHRI